MSALSPTHLLVLLGVILALFGAKRLPNMGRSIGHAVREFRSGAADKRESAAVQVEAPSAIAAEVVPTPTARTI